MKVKGVRVVDATKPLRLSITDEDCKYGNKKEHHTCAAAVALLRQGEGAEVRVHVSRAYVKRGRKWVRYKVPASMRAEIIAFDRGGTFSPGEFVLSPVQDSVKLGKPKAKDYRPYKTKRPGYTRIKQPYHSVPGIRERMPNRGF